MNDLEKTRMKLDHEDIKRENARILDAVMRKGIGGKEITHEQLGRTIGVSDWAIKKYLSAENAPTPQVWQKLFEMTKNPMLYGVIDGGGKRLTFAIPDSFEDGVAGLQKILDAQSQSLGVIQLALDIVKDGKVDHLDRVAIQQMKDSLPHAINTQIQLVHGLDAEYQKNKSKRH